MRLALRAGVYADLPDTVDISDDIDDTSPLSREATTLGGDRLIVKLAGGSPTAAHVFTLLKLAELRHSLDANPHADVPLAIEVWMLGDTSAMSTTAGKQDWSSWDAGNARERSYSKTTAQLGAGNNHSSVSMNEAVVRLLADLKSPFARAQEMVVSSSPGGKGDWCRLEARDRQEVREWLSRLPADFLSM